jgi:hypothetical protein
VSLAEPSGKNVALVLWSDLFEDFLDHLGVSPEQFETIFMGGWVFKYVQAFEAAGIRNVS